MISPRYEVSTNLVLFVILPFSTNNITMSFLTKERKKMAMPIKSFLRTMSSGCKLKYVERKKIVKLQRSLLNDNNRRQMVVSPKVANCVMRGRLFMAKFIGATSHFSINVSLDIFLFFPKKEYFSLWQCRLWSFKSGDTTNCFEGKFWNAIITSVTIMCCNDELSWTMSWVGYLLTDKVLV